MAHALGRPISSAPFQYRACLRGGAVPAASNRSGETTDAYLSHIAVGMVCKVIKAWFLGGERIAKANELVRISEEVGASRLRRIF